MPFSRWVRLQPCVMVQKRLMVPKQQHELTPYSKVIAWPALASLCFFLD